MDFALLHLGYSHEINYRQSRLTSDLNELEASCNRCQNVAEVNLNPRIFADLIQASCRRWRCRSNPRADHSIPIEKSGESSDRRSRICKRRSPWNCEVAVSTPARGVLAYPSQMV